MLNYHDNLETQLLDACTNNSKLYWKLLKETFSKNKSTELPPLQNVSANGDIYFVFDNDEKIEILNSYFTSIANVDDSNSVVPELSTLCTLLVR
jgi:hypothetical protein